MILSFASKSHGIVIIIIIVDLEKSHHCRRGPEPSVSLVGKIVDCLVLEFWFQVIHAIVPIAPLQSVLEEETNVLADFININVVENDAMHRFLATGSFECITNSVKRTTSDEDVHGRDTWLAKEVGKT
jgi:hypothetical protein